ncbi:Cilia- and flagella-associated protein 99 [Eumeta japonica]|uniref:Cilia-and flagella-associated protein 99 n=1 Tax=Eumeta variegata TaxID=151549 RepID=A0A4C1X1E1_EUMVA|nr:Cilia- and flagella-associated protein 99 [Eumeta japonica]
MAAALIDDARRERAAAGYRRRGPGAPATRLVITYRDIIEHALYALCRLLIGHCRDKPSRHVSMSYPTFWNNEGRGLLVPVVIYAATTSGFDDLMCSARHGFNSLIFLRETAQSFYDIRYVSEKILAPLHAWQPFIADIKTKYMESIQNMKKPPTVPIPPNLSIKINETLPTLVPILPSEPMILTTNKKMLTKDSIDEKLQREFERNKEKANQLLSKVKSINNHYAQNKSERYNETVMQIREELENKEKTVRFRPPKIINKSSSMPPRDTIATIRRMNKTMRETEQKEIEWLNTLLSDFKDMPKIEDIERLCRSEREKRRVIEIEKKHLKGQISFEQAIIAKKELIEENKKKYANFLKERDTWNTEIEKWRKDEMEKNREQLEKSAMQQAAVLQSKYNNIIKKKENAKVIKEETELLLSKAMKEKNEELERRINVVKEIKVLSIIASKAKLPKIIDLTETSGLGLMSEMSIAELQERLNIAKMNLHEELNKKTVLLRDKKLTMKQELGETKQLIDEFLNERREIRKRNKNIMQESCDSAIEGVQEKEISNLKKLLAEKKMQSRLKLVV